MKTSVLGSKQSLRGRSTRSTKYSSTTISNKIRYLVTLHGLQAALQVGEGDPLVHAVGEPGGGEAELAQVRQDHSVSGSLQDPANLKALEDSIY